MSFTPKQLETHIDWRSSDVSDPGQWTVELTERIIANSIMRSRPRNRSQTISSISDGTPFRLTVSSRSSRKWSVS